MAVPLTPDDIKALDFGYITGLDLIKYCPIQFLIKQETIDTGFTESCVLTAYQEVIGALSSRCDIVTEYTKTTDRSLQVVKLTALSAIRNAVSNIPDIPQQMKDNFTWLDKTMLAIRNGQMSLPNVSIITSDTDPTKVSSSTLVSQTYRAIG